MDSKAVAKAESRLRVAHKAATDLGGCCTYHDFIDTWYTFITAAKNIWTVLEIGAKTNAQSLQWFGAKKAERRQDELLQYLFEARNDDEHGIEEVTEHVPGSLAIGVAKSGYSSAIRINNLTIRGGKLISGSVSGLDGRPVLVEQTLPHARLSPVRPRGRAPIDPPQVHLGEALVDKSPIALARVALTYLGHLVAEADQRARMP